MSASNDAAGRLPAGASADDRIRQGAAQVEAARKNAQAARDAAAKSK